MEPCLLKYWEGIHTTVFLHDAQQTGLANSCASDQCYLNMKGLSALLSPPHPCYQAVSTPSDGRIHDWHMCVTQPFIIFTELGNIDSCPADIVMRLKPLPRPWWMYTYIHTNLLWAGWLAAGKLPGGSSGGTVVGIAVCLLSAIYSLLPDNKIILPPSSVSRPMTIPPLHVLADVPHPPKPFKQVRPANQTHNTDWVPVSQGVLWVHHNKPDLAFPPCVICGSWIIDLPNQSWVE